MALTLIYLIFRQQLAWLAVLARDDAARTAEILLLRHGAPRGASGMRHLGERALQHLKVHPDKLAGPAAGG
jgi:hypothetical protein